MEINANFSQRVVVHSERMAWQASPMSGVVRKPLDRVGEEVARATTIVQYDPGSHFSSHTHTGGEEFIVLTGTFQDEHGDYPFGSYIRNPPGSKHTPGAAEGCCIFVKLWQFEPDDRVAVRTRLDLDKAKKTSEGVRQQLLYADTVEQVSIAFCEPGAELYVPPDNGIEILVLQGDLQEGHDRLQTHSWLRVPVGHALQANIGPEGAVVWLKKGHLARVNEEIARVNAVINP